MESTAFDIYDEQWRDCWVAATACGRARRRAADVNLKEIVARLLHEHGPQGKQPFTLRVYGTLIKGFCVINNDRAKALHNDSERVIYMFARKPFSRSNQTLEPPGAKAKCSSEAAFTLDLNVQRVEEAEGFDWAQASLEPGALVDLSAAHLLPELPPTVPFVGLGAADPAGNFGSLLGQGDGGGLPPDAAWLPVMPLEAADGLPGADGKELLMSQIVASEVADAEAKAGMEAPQAPQEATAEAAVQPVQEAAAASQLAGALAAAGARKRLRYEPLRPGMVYGFDGEPSMAPEEYENWQVDDQEVSYPRKLARNCAEELLDMDEASAGIDRIGPQLRSLMESSFPAFIAAFHFARSGEEEPGKADAQQQEAMMLQQVVEVGPEQRAGMPGEMPADMGGAPGQAYDDGSVLAAALANALPPPGMGVEVQDDRTAEVGEIIRGCLRRSGCGSMAFSDLMPVSCADRGTAACTFAALLALASAGEMIVTQDEPYSEIMINEVVR